jgi:hypothetical protein
MIFSVTAQLSGQVADPGSAARFHAGAVGVTPSIALSSFGYDTNVFYETGNPKADLTGIIEPQLNAWLHLGRVQVAWNGRANAVFFKRYSDQGTFGAGQTARLDVPVNRLRFNVTAGNLSARERPGFEIDTRARRTEALVTAGVDWRVTALTQVTATVRRNSVAFANDDVFAGRSLAQALDRSGQEMTLSIQHALTPLSSVVGSYSVVKDMFDHEASRNSRSRRVAAGFAFKPLALITGRIEAGFLKFEPNDQSVTPLTAPSVSGDLGYTLRGVTNFGIRLERAVNYSIDDTQAYYLQTGISGSVTHRLNETVHVTGTVTRQRLAYQTTATAGPQLALGSPLTVVNGIDVGLGYQLASSIQWGVHASYMNRAVTGGTVAGGYDDFKLMLSIGYGSNR